MHENSLSRSVPCMLHAAADNRSALGAIKGLHSIGRGLEGDPIMVVAVNAAVQSYRNYEYGFCKST